MDHHRREGEHTHADGREDRFFEPNSPHFFKIILHKTVQNGKLRIPKEFTRKYCRSDFSGNQMVSLKVPSGDVWNMEMKTCEDNQLCLQRGWPEFVAFYGIKHGHFLVFKYKRRDMFHVRIYDTSTMEIKYLIKSSYDNKDQENIPLGEDRSRRDTIPQMPNKNSNPHSLAQHEEVVGASSADNTIEIEDTYYEEVEGYSQNKTKPQMSNGNRESHKSRVVGGTNTRTYKRQHMRVKWNRASERASSFKSKNQNPYFSIVMYPSHVKRSVLDIPRGLFAECLKLHNTAAVELCTSAGRVWTVKYIYNVYNNNRKRCKLTTGWRGFVEDNKLVEGDVCVFELIKRAPIVFHVAISRVSEDPTFGNNMPASARGGGFGGSKPMKSIQRPNSRKMRGDQLIRRSSLDITNPSFSIVMQPSYIGILNVPRSVFIRHLGLMSSRTVRLCISDGRIWTVQYNYTVCKNQAFCKLGYGWREFVKDNNLEEGDECVFKLINPGPTLIVFHVTICKDSALHNNMRGKRKREDQILCSQPRKKLEPATASKGASKHAVLFRIAMTQSRLFYSNLSIPSGAARRMFMLSEETVKDMKLEVEDKTWSVKAFYYPKYGSGKISAGWTKFAKENFLKVGDICSFELVDSEKMVVRVSIERVKMICLGCPTLEEMSS